MECCSQKGYLVTLIQSLCKMSVQKGEVYLLNRKDVFRDFVGISEF